MSQKAQLALLSAVTAPTTALTYSNMTAALVALGIVKNPETLRALKLLQSQMPAGTPATLGTFLSLITGLVKISPDSKPSDHARLETVLKSLAASDNPDPPLTWGMFIPILQRIMAAGDLRPSKPEKGK